MTFLQSEKVYCTSLVSSRFSVLPPLNDVKQCWFKEATRSAFQRRQLWQDCMVHTSVKDMAKRCRHVASNSRLAASSDWASWFVRSCPFHSSVVLLSLLSCRLKTCLKNHKPCPVDWTTAFPIQVTSSCKSNSLLACRHPSTRHLFLLHLRSLLYMHRHSLAWWNDL